MSPRSHPNSLVKGLRTLVEEFGWIHTGVGLIGNLAFFLGSIAFLPNLGNWEAIGMEWKTVGVWLFILGSFLMLIGSAGGMLVKVFEAKRKT